MNTLSITSVVLRKLKFHRGPSGPLGCTTTSFIPVSNGTSTSPNSITSLGLGIRDIHVDTIPLIFSGLIATSVRDPLGFSMILLSSFLMDTDLTG